MATLHDDRSIAMLGAMATRDPTIRFFKGPTGHRVAYAEHGTGPALVCSAWWVSHLEEDWKQEGFRKFFEGLGEHFTVYRYDRAGSGLSDRERERVEPADEVATLAALIDHLALERLSLFGLTCACPPALDFAARQPERVDKLILFGSYLRGPEVAPPNVQEALSQIVRVHWGMGAKLLTDLLDPDVDGSERKEMCRVQRMSASSEMAALLLKLTFESDVSELAPSVRTPALVLHRKGDRTIPFAAGREMAATLPNATFQPLEGSAHVPWAGDVDAALEAMLRFFDHTSSSPPPTPTEQTASGCALHRTGDVWMLTFDGVSVHLKHARGLSDLATLLTNPSQDIPADSLWTGDDTAGPLAQTDDPILDHTALQTYRERLRALEDELASTDGPRADALLDEREALSRELRAALGLGGRRRELDSSSERARKAVTARLRASIEKISQALPAAGAHLTTTITTGTFCSYRPPEGMHWDVR